MRLGIFFATTIVVVALAGCASLPADLTHAFNAPGPFDPNNFMTAEKGVQLRLASHEGKSADEVLAHVALSSGQIVLTDDSGTPMALVATISLLDFLPYTHAGFLVMENDEPFVYEMQTDVADMRKFGTIDWLKGTMIRESLKDEISSHAIVSVFDLPPEADRGRLLAYIKKAYEQHVPFDPLFDATDHSRLYCSEFIAAGLEQANASSVQPAHFRDYTPFAAAFRLRNIPDTGVFAPGLFADPARHVATFSEDLSPAQITADFEIKRELHRRFTSDQRFGALFEIQGNSNIELRPAIQQFMSQAMLMARFAKTSDPKQMEEMIHSFAASYFAD